MRRAAILFSLVALGAGMVALAGWSPSARTTSPVSAHMTRAANQPAVDVRWTVGDHTRFALSSVRTMQSGEASLRFTAQGTWSARVAQVAPAGPTLVMQLTDAQIAAGAVDATRPLTPKGASAPFGVRLDGSGRVRALGFAPEVEPTTRAFLASLAADLQLARSDGTEASPVGRFKARYARSGAQLTRRNIGFASLASLAGQPAPEGLRVEVLAATTTADLDAERPTHIEHRERLRYHGLPGLDALSTVETSARRIHFARGAPPRIDPRWIWGPIDAPAPRANLDAALDRDLLKGADLPTLVDDFTTLDAAARGQRIPRLMALFRLHPETVEAALQRVRQGDPATAHLLGALSSAGTPRAQDALAEVLADETLDPALRALATTQLGLVERPTGDTADALTAAWQDGPATVAHNAALALGTVARAQPHALDPLLDALADAESPDATRLYLNALGNAGDPRAAAALEAGLAHADDAVRASAAYGLRFLPGDDIEARLTQLAARDASSAVRRRAEQALLARARR